MTRADSLEIGVVFGRVEAVHAVAANQRKLFDRCELVPQLLQAYGGTAIACLPQDIDHFAVGTSGPFSVRCPYRSNQRTHVHPEELPIRCATSHEPSERFVRVEHRELPSDLRMVYVEGFCAQRVGECLLMVCCRDDDNWCAGS